MPDTHRTAHDVTRRTFLTAAGLGLGGLTLAACGGSGGATKTAGGVAGGDYAAAIRAAEARRPHTGRTVTAELTARTVEVDLGGPVVRTLAYGDSIPAAPVSADIGDELAVTVTNRLDRNTSVHWHGIALRNDMDGAAPATPDITPGDRFTYRFTSPHAGTYWAHPHVGLDTDYGLYLPVIIDDPDEQTRYDAEWIVVLDDWTDGTGKSPDAILQGLRSGGMGHMGGEMSDMGDAGMGSMPGMGHGGGAGQQDPAGSEDSLLGSDTGDVDYPYYLINGRIPAAPTTFRAAAGQRVRLRIINAGADTAFRVALAGHTMTITHTDGFPVQPVEADAVLLGMGERVDAIITVSDGVFPLVASAEGKNALARALLRTAGGTAPPADFRPHELTGRVATVTDFTATDQVTLAPRKPDITLPVELSGNMMDYVWKINGRTYDNTDPLTVTEGQHARMTFSNHTMMWHPMHLHGHTFQVLRPDGSFGPRKDTLAVLPMQSMTVDLVADNPGSWMVHCHNGYHMDAGMMTRLEYTT